MYTLKKWYEISSDKNTNTKIDTKITLKRNLYFFIFRIIRFKNLTTKTYQSLVIMKQNYKQKI